MDLAVFVVRVECSEGHWFDTVEHDACPHLDAGEPCGWRAPEPEPVPPPRRESFDRHVADTTIADRDALAVMPTERVREVHRPGIAEARRALAEAEHRKGLDRETRERICGACS